MKYQCPCCGYYTFDCATGGSDEICKVCFWQDDYVLFNDPDFAGGPSKVSLNQARINYKEFGACEERFLPYVRKPKPDEMKE